MSGAKSLLQKARREGLAVGAFNAANIETLKAIIGAAKKLKSPVIIEASHGEVEYIGGENLVDLVKNAREEVNFPIYANLDHAPTVNDALKGIRLGFDLVHYDGSSLSFEENLKNTHRVVEVAHRKGVLVEAEIDHIQGSSAPHFQQDVAEAQKGGEYTDPDQAAEFIKKTGADTLAAFIGNVHGVYRNPPQLDLDRLEKIAQKTHCFLSLHGGSGIPDDQVKQAIMLGIVKVNVNTELRIAYRQATEKALKDSDEVAIYKIMPPVIAAVQKVVETKIRLFGSVGKADLV